VDRRAGKGSTMIHTTTSSFESADQVFNEGMERWWAGHRREALTYFRRAIKVDPLHAASLGWFLHRRRPRRRGGEARSTPF
jgi:hypothetical protein